MKNIIKAQNGTSLSSMFINSFENAKPVWRAKNRVKQERESMSNVPSNPYDYTKYWRDASEDKAKLAKYIAEESGYSPESAQAYYDDSMNGSRAELGLTGAAMVALPILGAVSTGTFGIIPQIGLNGFLAKESLDALKSDDGIKKTISLTKNASNKNINPYLRKKYAFDAVRSGTGDLLDATIALPFFAKEMKIVGNAKKLSKQRKYDKYLKNLKNAKTNASELLEYPGYQMPELQIQPELLPNRFSTGTKTYITPSTTTKSIFLESPIMSDFSGVENVAAENFGLSGERPNFGLMKAYTENRAQRLAKSYDQEINRNRSALNWYGKSWNDLSSLDRYWLNVNHGKEWKGKDIVARLKQQ